MVLFLQSDTFLSYCTLLCRTQRRLLFLYPNSVSFTTVSWMCELQLDWVAHENRNPPLSALVSFRAFLFCWLQILLGRIHPLPELGGETDKGKAVKCKTLLVLPPAAVYLNHHGGFTINQGTAINGWTFWFSNKQKQPPATKPNRSEAGSTNSDVPISAIYPM